MKKSLSVFVSMVLFTLGVHAQFYHSEIKNIVQPNNTTIEFDVIIYNTGVDTLYLAGYQAGIYFNYNGLANGGTITGGFVPGSSYNPATGNQLFAPQNNPNWNINATSHQIRLIAAIQTAKPLAAVLLPNAAPVKMGTFRMTNTVPFTTCTKPNFVWSFVPGSGLTNTSVIGWINGAVSTSSWVTQSSFSYTNQGPEYYVESNPNINPSISFTTFNALACNNYNWMGNLYTTSGTYYDTIPSSNGCDSVLVLNLVIDTPTVSNFFANACDQYTWSLNGQTYNSSGQYQVITLQPSGCTHTDVLNLTINYSTSGSSSVTTCDYYLWPVNNQIYVSSGVYTFTGINSSGCPDVQTLYLTLGHSSSHYDTVYNCNSIVWNGQNIVSSGNYSYLTTNASGCDSTSYLNFNLITAVNDTQTVHSCGPYTVASNTYITSGTYYYQTTNQFGCIINHVLYLTVGQNTYSNTSLVNCGSLYYNNTLYATSGVFTTIMTNQSGCDSVITLSVTINQPITLSQYITVCDNYTLMGTTYTSSGTYTAIGSTSAGCDSIVILYLTVKKSTSSYNTQTAINSFTWANNGFTYYTSGIYTYTSVNGSGCSNYDTLDLTIEFPAGVTEQDVNEMNLFPNPAHSVVNLSWDDSKNQALDLYLMDMSGRVVKKAQYQAIIGHNTMELPLTNLANGLYILEMRTEDQKLRYRNKVMIE